MSPLMLETVKRAAGAAAAHGTSLGKPFAVSVIDRVGRPEDIAKAVLELADNGYSTGQIRTVDGGARVV